MFFRRGRSTDDPWLGHKIWLFGIGAILALLGMAARNDWLIGAAALALAAGMVLRFLPQRGDADPVDRDPDSP